MTPRKPVKWTVSVPESVDVATRMHLAQQGMRKGDLSALVVEAIAGEVARRNVAAAREHNREVEPEVFQQAVSEALRAVRSDGHPERS